MEAATVQNLEDMMGEDKGLPMVLASTIQEPLIFCWWTVGKLASFILKYWDIIKRMARAGGCQHILDKGCQNKIALGLQSLMYQDKI
jgi:hypothetical protein